MTSGKPVVEILLATYNGERFLREQMDSILAQTYGPLRILARDDGSSDSTAAILAEYAASHPAILRILTGPPTGNAKFNFLKLLEASTAPYVAFCDQDDIWTPEKVALEMEAMHRLEAERGASTPALVFSDLQVVDAALTTTHASLWAHQRINPANIHRLRSIIMQNTVTGCTALLNRPLTELALQMPPEVYMHDWWVAVLACAFGVATPLPQRLVLYRQHGGNVLGASVTAATGMPRWRDHGWRLAAWNSTTAMADALLNTCGASLTPPQIRDARLFLQIDESPSALMRALNFLRLRVCISQSLRSTLAMLWLVINLRNARRAVATL